MTIVLRAGRPADVSGVLDLWHEAKAAPTKTDDFESIIKLITHDPAALIVAVDEGRVVGSIIAGWDGWRGSIYRLAVAPDYRRRGLGHRLLAAGEERLTEVGAVRMQAVVVGSDVPATGFWQSTSWERQQDRLRFVNG